MTVTRLAEMESFAPDWARLSWGNAPSNATVAAARKIEFERIVLCRKAGYAPVRDTIPE